jgi:hypothetical protein
MDGAPTVALESHKDDPPRRQLAGYGTSGDASGVGQTPRFCKILILRIAMTPLTRTTTAKKGTKRVRPSARL